MSRNTVAAATVAGLALAFAQAPQAAQDLDAWLQEAQLGPYAPAEEDWDAIYEAAKAEPPLQVYMTTSRVNQPIAPFQELYPGVEVEGLHIPASDMLERVRRERQAGIHELGILHTDDPERYLQEFGDELISYVPPELMELIPEPYREPLLIYRFLPTGWTYKESSFPDAPPMESLWDVTTEPFRGKVLIADPLRTGSVITYLVSVVGHADELEAEYQRHFGQPIELREKDAGWEWLRRLLENEPVILPGTRDVAEAITNSDGLMVGLNNFSRAREVLDGRYDFTFVMGLQPADMVNLPHPLSIMAFTPSPNAAKLFTRYLLTLEGGAPWFAEGNPSPRTDWRPTEAWIEPILLHTKWDVDYDFLLENTDDLIDFWLVHRR
jgi:iron(III) transport system substrate-binding protein